MWRSVFDVPLQAWPLPLPLTPQLPLLDWVSVVSKVRFLQEPCEVLAEPLVATQPASLSVKSSVALNDSDAPPFSLLKLLKPPSI